MLFNDLPIRKRPFSMAMLNNQRVQTLFSLLKGYLSKPPLRNLLWADHASLTSRWRAAKFTLRGGHVFLGMKRGKGLALTPQTDTEKSNPTKVWW
jgi:hypothetical protein